MADPKDDFQSILDIPVDTRDFDSEAFMDHMNSYDDWDNMNEPTQELAADMIWGFNDRAQEQDTTTIGQGLGEDYTLPGDSQTFDYEPE